MFITFLCSSIWTLRTYNLIYKFYKYCNRWRHENYLEGSPMSKCEKCLNTDSAVKVKNNKPCNALSCVPSSLKSFRTNSAWNAYNPKPSHDQSCDILGLENMIYKSYKYCNDGRHDIYMEGLHIMLCILKCDKRLNTNSAGKVQNNKSWNAQSCDPLSLKGLNTHSA